MEVQSTVARLYIMCGFPFSGKSTVASRLVAERGFHRVSVDDINAEFGVGVDPDQPITQAEWDLTYTTFFQRIADLLRRGHSVIADTADYSRAERDQLREVADSCSVEPVIIHVRVPVALSQQRLLHNRLTKARHDVRDDDFDNVIRYFEEPSAPERVVVYGPGMDWGAFLRDVTVQP